jgi:ferric-dicitrate binding protein FerR (iron transport regulator)
MEKKLYILIRKFLRKQADIREILQLKELFAKGDTEEQLSGFYEEAWGEADFIPEKEVEERVWAKLQKQIHIIKPIPVKLSLWKKNLHIAASILVPLLCIGLGYYYAKNTPIQDNDRMTVQVEIGQKAKMQLPDGTSVWLNSAGLLTYDNAYNKKERVVHLQGEAYFEVKKDKTRPFVVKMNDLSVEALGTSFDIKAYPDDNYIAATLIEGSIRISSPTQSELLAPNEKLTITKNDGQFTKSVLPDAKKNVAWINNQLTFEQERMENIAKTLERMYNVRIRFASDKLENLRFSGTIKNNNLENVLQVIEFVSPIRYVREKDATIIIRDKQQEY